MTKYIFSLFVICLLVQSCARIGSPVGGNKDTLAPKFLYANIDTTKVNVDRNIRELKIYFDEYITLKDISKNLSVSPPLKKIKKILPTTLANKYLLIQWEDTLKANTTYNFNFGNAITDNNENNVLRYYNFAFSTGEKIDNLYISGEVKDPMKLKKQEGSENKWVVGLYQEKDTINYKEKPYYVTKVDDDGYFELNFLAPGVYQIIAFDDENQNSIFDSGKEKIAFSKEKIALQTSISGKNLALYPSKKPEKYLEAKSADGGVLMKFEGNPKEVKIASIKNAIKNYQVTHRPYSDSVSIWLDYQLENIDPKTTTKLEFGYQTKSKSDTISVFYKPNPKATLDIASDNGGSLLTPNEDFKIRSNFPLTQLDIEKWSLKKDSTQTQAFNAKISPTNPYQMLISSAFEQGKKYQLTIPKESVSSFYIKNSVSTRFDFEVDKVENFGQLKFKLKNAPSHPFWIQLINNSEIIIRSMYTKDKEINFKNLKPGEYAVRILIDENENQFWDTTDFDKQQFAEPVITYYKSVVIRPLWDSIEDWDLEDKRAFEGFKSATENSNRENNTERAPGLSFPNVKESN